MVGNDEIVSTLQHLFGGLADTLEDIKNSPTKLLREAAGFFTPIVQYEGIHVQAGSSSELDPTILDPSVFQVNNYIPFCTYLTDLFAGVSTISTSSKILSCGDL